MMYFGRGVSAGIAFVFAVGVLDIVAMGIVVPVLPTLIEQFTGSNGEAGWVNGLFVALWAAMQFAVSPLVGSLSDRWGRRPIILASAAGLAADYVLMALAPTLLWLVVGRVIAGATSATFSTVNAYVADVTPPHLRARTYGLLGAAFSCGFVGGPMLGGGLGELSPRLPFWTAAALSTLTFAYGLFVLPESLPPEKRMAFAWKRANPFGALQLLRANRELSALALTNFLMYFANYVFSAVFVLYASYRYHWSIWQVGAVFAAIGVLDMIVQGTMVGRLSAKLGDRAMLLIGLIGGAIGVAGMGIAPSGSFFALAVVPSSLRMLAVPALQSLMTGHASQSQQGQLQGATMSIASLAGVVAPLFFGAIYSLSVGNGSTNGAMVGLPFLVAGFILLGAGCRCWISFHRPRFWRAGDAATSAIASSANMRYEPARPNTEKPPSLPAATSAR